MDPHAAQPWLRPALLVGAVIAACNAAFWAFVGLDGQGWSRPALAVAFTVIGCYFVVDVVRVRD